MRMIAVRYCSLCISSSLFLLAVLPIIAQAAKLSVNGRDLIYNGQRVFLSGVNIAWNAYGYDFGNGQYESNSRSILEGWLSQIADNGGNSIRKFAKHEINRVTHEEMGAAFYFERHLAARRGGQHAGLR